MPKKLKNANGYNVDDLVFARVRGYPPWPARVSPSHESFPMIIKYNNIYPFLQIVEVGLKYKVIFFGTKET